MCLYNLFLYLNRWLRIETKQHIIVSYSALQQSSHGIKIGDKIRLPPRITYGALMKKPSTGSLSPNTHTQTETMMVPHGQITQHTIRHLYSSPTEGYTNMSASTFQYSLLLNYINPKHQWALYSPILIFTQRDHWWSPVQDQIIQQNRNNNLYTTILGMKCPVDIKYTSLNPSPSRQQRTPLIPKHHSQIFLPKLTPNLTSKWQHQITQFD